jgi:hypothetical protein
MKQMHKGGRGRGALPVEKFTHPAEPQMSKDEKKKGGQKSWATNEQREWLTATLPAYIASRASESPSDFWAGVFEEWFEKWPLGLPEAGDESSTEDQLKRKKAVSRLGGSVAQVYLQNFISSK